MSIDSESFKKAMSIFASGVTVVTYKNGNEDSGITVSAFTSVSLKPPIVLVSINNESQAVKAIRDYNYFSVNLLNNFQVEVSNTFAKKDESRSKIINYFSLNKSSNGISHIRNALSSIDCELYADYEGGDHRIFLGKVLSIEFPEDKNSSESTILPLIYHNKCYKTVKDL